MCNQIADQNPCNSAVKVAVCAASKQLIPITQQLAKQLDLNWYLDTPVDKSNYEHISDFLLVVAPNDQFDYQLEVRDTRNLKSKLLIDFCAGNTAYRAHYGGGRKQALARAIGLKKGVKPIVLDATAGLGRDSFVLANLGCNVQLIERSPIIFTLLRDGLRRARIEQNQPAGNWITTRMQLTLGDALQLIPELCKSKSIDVIYLDPMYPQRTKSALVKKEMRFLQSMLGKDPDADHLLNTSLQHARKRVVVKRPRSAPYLAGKQPSHSIETKKTRFDVYMLC